MRSISTTTEILDLLYQLVRVHAPELKRFVLTAILIAKREEGNPPQINTIYQTSKKSEIARMKTADQLKESKKEYIEKRIIAEKKYYTREYKKALPRALFLGKLAHVAAILAVIAVVLAFSYKIAHISNHTDGTQKISSSERGINENNSANASVVNIARNIVIYFLPIALPLIAGMSSSLYVALDLGRRKNRYNKMGLFLSKQETWIEAIQSKIILERAILETEEILLSEKFDWYVSIDSGLDH